VGASVGAGAAVDGAAVGAGACVAGLGAAQDESTTTRSNARTRINDLLCNISASFYV
jgi:hypothetical protein